MKLEGSESFMDTAHQYQAKIAQAFRQLQLENSWIKTS